MSDGGELPTFRWEICCCVADAHNGQLRVESMGGRGVGVGQMPVKLGR